VDPAITLPPEEQKSAARTRKTWKFLVFLRAHRHALRDAAVPPTLAQGSSAEPGGTTPLEPGLVALATRKLVTPRL
jgi:hypothetical protein